MLILSRIITKEWFKALFSSLVVLFILITVGDIINGFLRSFSAQRVFLEYFLKLPELMGKVLPISALISTLFAINKLKSHSELMAILAAGYSTKKFYSLIALCSLSVSFFQFINLGHLQPLANSIKRLQFEKSNSEESKYIARSKIGTTGLMWYKTDDYFTSFSAFDNKNNILKNVTFYYYNSVNQVSKIIKSQTAQYINENWTLKNVTIFEDLNSKGFAKIKAQKDFNLQINERPIDFNQFESDITTLNFFNLYRFINRLDQTGISTYEYKVMLFDKLALSIICFIFALIPAQGVFNPNRRSSSFGKNIIFTLLFSILFWLLYSSLITQGVTGKISPWVATLSIPIVSGLYVAWTFLRNRTL